MSVEVVYSPEALHDLDRIWEWIAIEHEEPAAAERTVQCILERVDGIAALPHSTPSLNSRCRIRSDWRFVEACNYLAFFRVSTERIYVDRILSGKSDYLRKLFGVEDGTGLYR